MIKTATVASIKPIESYSTQYGTFYPMWVNFDNGDSGMYTSKSMNQTKFVVGQPAYYSATPTTAKSGKTYNKIKPESAEFAQANGAPVAAASNNQDEIVRQTCLIAAASVAKNSSQALQAAKTFFEWANKANGKNESIVRQSCLKTAATISATSKEKVLEVAEQLLAFVYEKPEPVQYDDHFSGRQDLALKKEPASTIEEDDLPF